MNDKNLINRITINPEICHGKPIIRNSRYLVESILELLASGMTTFEILEDYEDLEADDIYACLEFSVRITKVKSISNLVA